MHDAEAGSLYSVIVVSDTLPVFCEEPFAVVTMILQNKTPSDFVKPQFSLTVYSWIERELQVGTSLGRRHNLVRFQI